MFRWKIIQMAPKWMWTVLQKNSLECLVLKNPVPDPVQVIHQKKIHSSLTHLSEKARYNL